MHLDLQFLCLQVFARYLHLSNLTPLGIMHRVIDTVRKIEKLERDQRERPRFWP
jgi:hypothetical protein